MAYACIHTNIVASHFPHSAMSSQKPAKAKRVTTSSYIASVLVWETLCFFPRFIWCRVAVFSPFSVLRPHLFSFFPYLSFFPITSLSCLRLRPISTARIGIRKRRSSFTVSICCALWHRSMALMNSAMLNAIPATIHPSPSTQLQSLARILLQFPNQATKALITSMILSLLRWRLSSSTSASRGSNRLVMKVTRA